MAHGQMDPRVANLIAAMSAFAETGGVCAVLDDLGVLLCVDPSLIPPKPWPSGVRFRPLTYPVMPPLDALLTVNEAVEYARALGATAMTKWDVHKDIRGQKRVGKDGKLRWARRPKYVRDVDYFERGGQYYLRPEAVERRVRERLRKSVVHRKAARTAE